MPYRLAQQRMTLSDLECPFHTLRAISAVAELFVQMATFHCHVRHTQYKNIPHQKDNLERT